MNRLLKIAETLDLRATGKWFVLSTMIGLVGGLGAIVFQFLIQLVQHFTLLRISGYPLVEAAGEPSLFHEVTRDFVPWLVVAVMALGGLVSGLLVYTFAPEAEGHGTDAAIDAYHNKKGRIRPIVPLVKALASAVTLGTGGSGGREGPIAQIGAGFGSFLATRMGLSHRDRRIMLAAGMAAGIGAIFRAPLAGALFAGEILYRDADLDSDVVVPAAISSIVSYSVYSMTLPADLRFMPLFGKNLHFHMASPLELIPYAILAVILAIMAHVYIKVFYGTHTLMQRIPVANHVRPALGAALAGILSLGLYFALGDELALGALSTGYGTLQQAVSPNPEIEIGLKLLVLVALAKVFTTSLTISSGGSGGVFGPSMVIGGCLGAAVGQFFHRIWPTVVIKPQAFAIVGMAGFFAGAARAPFSTIIMVSEMTGDYQLLLPTMWVSTLCFLLCSRTTLYQQQVASRVESPAHHGDFVIDVLEGIKVADVYQRGRELIKIPEGTTLKSIVHTLAMSTQRYFAVVDEKDNMIGVFSAEDVRSYLYDEAIWQLAVARDVMVSPFVSVSPREDLNTALRRFTAINVDELPVIDPDDSGKLLGMLRRKEAIAAYNRRLMEHKQMDER